MPYQQVLERINEIVEKSGGGNHYIYRGEPEIYDKSDPYRVTSSLYRQVPHYKDMKFNMKDLENQILEEVKDYIVEKDVQNFQLLTEIQHFGGTTNLIDFTEDYLIALFFACNKSPGKPGRIIILTEDPAHYKVHKTSRTISRVAFQKSIFVEPLMGFIEVHPRRIVTIPADLKAEMLDYLQKYHGISHKTIYSDLHGFIGHSAYAEVCRGFNYQRLANAAKCWEDQRELYNKAIDRYTDAAIINPEWVDAYFNRGRAYLLQRESFNNAHPNQRSNFEEINVLCAALEDFNKTIELVPRHAGAYCNRGRTHHLYFQEESFRSAIKDYDTAIDLNSDISNAYCNRGEVRLHIEEWESAKDDLCTAKSMGTDIIGSFHNDYRDFEDFENRNNVQLPDDIKELLTPNS